MTRQYSPKTFLRQSPNPVLQQYFRSNDISLEVDWKCLTPRRIDPLFDAIEALPDEVRDAVEQDFRLIFAMATPKGRLLLIEQGAVLGVDLSERLDGVENHYEAAMVAFLEHREVFDTASCVHGMVRLDKRKRLVGKRLHASEAPEQINAFEEALRRTYRRQGRGRSCHVDRYQRRDPMRFCYFAYPEDFPISDVEYDEDHNFRHVTRRPAMENAFVYVPEAGTLQIGATGDKEHKEKLAEAFCKHILGLKELPPEDGSPRYTLERVMEPSFEFPIEPEDGIERMDIKTLRVDTGDAEQSRITLDITPNGTPNGIHASIGRNLNPSVHPQDSMFPSQAVIVTEFKSANGKRGPRVKTRVTYPDRCSLGDDPQEQVVHRVLQRAEIASE